MKNIQLKSNYFFFKRIQKNMKRRKNKFTKINKHNFFFLHFLFFK